MLDVLDNVLLLYLCLLATTGCAIAFHTWRRQRRLKVLKWARRQLRPLREQIEVQHKTLIQLQAWHPGDPKTVFMREYLHRQIRTHNLIVDKIDAEARNT